MNKLVRLFAILVTSVALAGCATKSEDATPTIPKPIVGSGCELSPGNLESLPHLVAGHAEKPAFPVRPLVGRVEGEVEFVFTINADGSVSDIKQVRESPVGYGFGLAAKQAFEKFLYYPARINGAPVAVSCWPYRFNFRLR